MDFRVCSIITVYLTPSENPDITGKPVMENTHMVEQYLAVEIDDCVISHHPEKLWIENFSKAHPISSNISEILIE